ncbi:MAG: hypothetical protein COC12_09360 [Rhodobacteraceae bacterium]|nr:MAG: hypothetical protein COC12_09360 [Paracoccaceae bacterium]
MIEYGKMKEFDQLLGYLKFDGVDLPSKSDARTDVNLIYRMFELEKIVRFFGQRYWEEESLEDSVQPGALQLENVAAHTFQVASSAQHLAQHFPKVNRERAIELALVHDELEVITGDKDPVGPDGQGLDTHAFNAQRRIDKELEERSALEELLSEMRPSMRADHRILVEESTRGETIESRFLKSVDKLQALAFVRLKKVGNISPDHAAFTIRYSKLGVDYFPELQMHFICVLEDLLNDVHSILKHSTSSFCDATLERLSNVAPTNRPSIRRFALIGKSGVGKSTVAMLLKLHYGAHRVSTGQICRKIAHLLFGNEAKESTQRIDDALTQIDPSIFLNAALLSAPIDQSICVDSLRFKSDMAKARQSGFTIVRIVAAESTRLQRLSDRGQEFDPAVEGLHRSETELDQAQVDHTITNDGNIAALETVVSKLCLDDP